MLTRMERWRGQRGDGTIVRATCPECGDVELTVNDLSATVDPATNEGAYAFVCPNRDLDVVKNATPHVIDLLVSAGVHLTVHAAPPELDEIHVGPAITHDDLLAFHDRLQDDDWFAEVEALVAEQR